MRSMAERPAHDIEVALQLGLDLDKRDVGIGLNNACQRLSIRFEQERLVPTRWLRLWASGGLDPLLQPDHRRRAHRVTKRRLPD